MILSRSPSSTDLLGFVEAAVRKDLEDVSRGSGWFSCDEAGRFVGEKLRYLFWEGHPKVFYFEGLSWIYYR